MVLKGTVAVTAGTTLLDNVWPEIAVREEVPAVGINPKVYHVDFNIGHHYARQRSTDKSWSNAHAVFRSYPMERLADGVNPGRFLCVKRGEPWRSSQFSRVVDFQQRRVRNTGWMVSNIFFLGLSPTGERTSMPSGASVWSW